MSVINKMLQDLDRRNAMAADETEAVPPAVKAVDPATRGGRDWFWRVVAALLFLAVAWVAWVAYQLLPRPLITDEVLRALQGRAAPVPAAPAALPVILDKAQPVEPVQTFQLARAIETPIAARQAPPAKPAPRVAKPAAAPAPAEPVAIPIAKSEPIRTARDDADALFRRAALFLNQGRVSEAEAELARALKSDPSHTPSRQAYVALLLEQGRMEDARQLLEQALAAAPAQAVFVPALARIHVELGNYPAALEVMDKAGPVAQKAEVQALRAVVLQRMGRHDEAVTSYQQALRGGPQGPATWMGLAISLEALGHRSEAAQAYRRALGAGPLAAQARDYAEARVRALD